MIWFISFELLPLYSRGKSLRYPLGRKQTYKTNYSYYFKSLPIHNPIFRWNFRNIETVKIKSAVKFQAPSEVITCEDKCIYNVKFKVIPEFKHKGVQTYGGMEIRLQVFQNMSLDRGNMSASKFWANFRRGSRLQIRLERGWVDLIVGLNSESRKIPTTPKNQTRVIQPVT
jgi:hypothetical protein